MDVWRSAGSPTGLLERIEKAARTDADMTEAYEALVHPRPPSAEQIESNRQLAEMQHQSARDRAARDQSWVEFVDQDFYTSSTSIHTIPKYIIRSYTKIGQKNLN